MRCSYSSMEFSAVTGNPPPNQRLWNGADHPVPRRWPAFFSDRISSHDRSWLPRRSRRHTAGIKVRVKITRANRSVPPRTRLAPNRERAFDQLPALPQEPLALGWFQPLPVGVDRVALLFLPHPMAFASLLQKSARIIPLNVMVAILKRNYDTPVSTTVSGG